MNVKENKKDYKNYFYPPDYYYLTEMQNLTQKAFFPNRVFSEGVEKNMTESKFACFFEK